MTKAKMWYGKMPRVPYQLQEWYGICRVCRIGAGATVKSTAANFAACWTEARRVWTVCGGDLNPGPSAPEPSALTSRRIRWHYTTTILRFRIDARLTRYRNCKFHNGCRTISRHADGISRYSVPPSAGPLLPLAIEAPLGTSRWW